MEDICDFCRARLFWVLNLNENLCNIYRKLGLGAFEYEMSSMRDRLREREREDCEEGWMNERWIGAILK